MRHERKIATAKALPRLTVELARHEDDVIAVQKLRWDVFAKEQGATLCSPIGGRDIDRFDAACDHLIVREVATQAVIGTYRILTAERAHALGGFYAEQEFDLGDVLSSRGQTVEIGRSCVHPNHRNGAAIALLWSGLAAYLDGTPYKTLIGCASITLEDGGHRAANIYAGLSLSHLTPPHRRARPHTPFCMTGLENDSDASLPPLIKGYLRSGAVVCGPPAHDVSFNTADLLVMLDLARMTSRYARHYRLPVARVAA